MRKFHGVSACLAILGAANLANSAHPAISATPPVARLSGAQLITYYVELKSAAGAPVDPYALLNQQFAKGYLAGVADSAEGRDWCDTSRVKTTELDSNVMAELKKLPAKVLKKDAARLVIDVLRKRFPCSTM